MLNLLPYPEPENKWTAMIHLTYFALYFVTEGFFTLKILSINALF